MKRYLRQAIALAALCGVAGRGAPAYGAPGPSIRMNREAPQVR
jgi:hypothetical protein